MTGVPIGYDLARNFLGRFGMSLVRNLMRRMRLGNIGVIFRIHFGRKFHGKVIERFLVLTGRTGTRGSAGSLWIFRIGHRL